MPQNVMVLLDNLLDTGRTLFTDKSYTSVALATELLQRNTYLIGTICFDLNFNC